jgi:co-chaperonin GroES (HSP10)
LIRPLHDRILIDPILPPSASAGGLWVPPDSTTFRYDRPNEVATAITRGRVVAKAPGVEVDVGEVVQFSDSCGRPVEHDGHRYLFIREDDVALIEE